MVAFEHHAELLSGDRKTEHEVTVGTTCHKPFSNSPLDAFLRPGSRGVVHFCFHRLSECIHRVVRTELRPEMFGITVVGSDTSDMAFLMGHDDPISQRVKTVFSAQHSKEFYGSFVGPFHSGDSFRLIGASEGRTTHIFDAGRLTHFNTDVGVVAGPAAMPAPLIPGQGLIDRSIIRINEAVYACALVSAFVPVFDENRSTRLGASNRV